MKTKYGDPLYTLKELAEASDTPEAVLRDWFNGGELTDYITIYQTAKGRKYYKWGPPYATDVAVTAVTYDLEVVR